MSEVEKFHTIILGSGQGGKLLAWHLGKAGHRTAVVERQWVGGSCPNVACMPSKNEIWSARVSHLARHAPWLNTVTGPLHTDMRAVQHRKRSMVEREVKLHVDAYKRSGAELIMGHGRFVGPKIIEVHLNDGGKRILEADQIVLNLGSRAAMPDIPGLDASQP